MEGAFWVHTGIFTCLQLSTQGWASKTLPGNRALCGSTAKEDYLC